MPNFIELGIYFLFGTKFFGNEGIGCNFDFLGGYVVVTATDVLITTGYSAHSHFWYECFWCTDEIVVVYIYIYIYIYIYTHDSQIVHHNPCFNLFILHNIPFDNQGS